MSLLEPYVDVSWSALGRCRLFVTLPAAVSSICLQLASKALEFRASHRKGLVSALKLTFKAATWHALCCTACMVATRIFPPYGTGFVSWRFRSLLMHIVAATFATANSPGTATIYGIRHNAIDAPPYAISVCEVRSHVNFESAVPDQLFPLSSV